MRRRSAIADTGRAPEVEGEGEEEDGGAGAEGEGDTAEAVVVVVARVECCRQIATCANWLVLTIYSNHDPRALSSLISQNRLSLF